LSGNPEKNLKTEEDERGREGRALSLQTPTHNNTWDTF
jgi:hypothetical protein